MAIIGAWVAVLHHRAARNLALTAEPGTLAAAIAVAGLSVIAHILDGKDTTEEMRAILADLHFTIDPVGGINIVALLLLTYPRRLQYTGRLRVEESEHGYSEVPSNHMSSFPESHRSPPHPGHGSPPYVYSQAGTADLDRL